jgi:hypothetical protein
MAAAVFLNSMRNKSSVDEEYVTRVDNYSFILKSKFIKERSKWLEIEDNNDFLNIFKLKMIKSRPSIDPPISERKSSDQSKTNEKVNDKIINNDEIDGKIKLSSPKMLSKFKGTVLNSKLKIKLIKDNSVIQANMLKTRNISKNESNIQNTTTQFSEEYSPTNRLESHKRTVSKFSLSNISPMKNISPSPPIRSPSKQLYSPVKKSSVE